MAEILTTYPNLPIWLMVSLLILNLFKQPIASMLFDRFPKMADSHFKALSADRIDRRESAQNEKSQLLQKQLEASEGLRNQAARREEDFIDIIKKAFDLLQISLPQQIQETENNLSAKIDALADALERLTKRINSRTKTQDLILERIEQK